MRPVPIVLAALALITAACGTAASGAPNSTTTSTSTPTTSTTRPTTTATRPTTTTTVDDRNRSPLTGLPLGDDQIWDRRALVVKVDNHPRARPQSGLSEADAVIELPVEGITRLVGVFHTGDAGAVGPVRSLRPTDWQVAALFDGPIVVSGGQDWVLSTNRRSGAEIIGEVGSPYTFRSGNRSAPHNLFADSSAIRDLADRRGYPDEPPAQLWGFGPLPAEAEPAEELRLDFFPGLVAGWSWDGTQYLRSTNGAAHDWIDADGNREQVSADVIVALFMQTYMQSPPQGGGPARAVESVGSGKALVFADGKVVEGEWSRPKASDGFELTDTEGEPLPVPPGRPWISFFPRTRSVSW